MVIREGCYIFCRAPPSFVENRGKPESQLWEKEQQGPDENEGDQERRNPLVDSAHGNLGYIFHHEYADGYRGNDHADHGDNADHDPEPQGMEPELEDSRIKDRGGKDQEGQIIDERAPNLENEADEES